LWRAKGNLEPDRQTRHTSPTERLDVWLGVDAKHDHGRSSEAIEIVPQSIFTTPTCTLGAFHSNAIAIEPIDQIFPSQSMGMNTLQSSMPAAGGISNEMDMDTDNPTSSQPNAPIIDSNPSATVQPNDPTSSSDPLVDSNPPISNGSPLRIDKAIQKQGEDLHELLQMFKRANSEPLSSFILQTPKNKVQTSSAAQNGPESQTKESNQKIQRKSPRLTEKSLKAKTILEKAQDLTIKKCGVVGQVKELDNMILQQYVDLYKHPLIEESLEAIMKLTEMKKEKKI
jgi:hypothetical protein